MPAEYAHALYQSLTGITDESVISARVASLVQVLKKAGKLKALPAIMREFMRIHARTTAVQPVLMVARAADVPGAQRALAARVPEAAATTIETVIDDTLIGGGGYVYRDNLIDTSYKAALLALYHRITK